MPAREAQSCNSCDSTSLPVLQEPTTMLTKGSDEKKGGGEGRLYRLCPPGISSHGGADMVATTPYQVEWVVPIFIDPIETDAFTIVWGAFCQGLSALGGGGAWL